jgi:hypothetical protein
MKIRKTTLPPQAFENAFFAGSGGESTDDHRLTVFLP